MHSFELLFFHDPLMPPEYGDMAVKALKSTAESLQLASLSVDRATDKMVVNAVFEDESRSSEYSYALSNAFYRVFPAAEEITYEDTVLGTMTYDDGLGWYEGAVDFGGRCITVCMHADTEGVDEARVDALRKVVLGLAKQIPKLCDHLSEEFLQLYNQEWKRLDELAMPEPLTPVGFKRRLSLDSIEVDEELWVSYRFGADGMFTEHGLAVDVAVDGSVSMSVR